jgi:cobalamin biosynthesis protein cobN
VGVGLARVGVLGNGDGRDPLGDGHVLGVGFFNELGEPGFEVQAVIEHQVGGMRLLQVGGGGLVLVDFSAGLGEGLDVQVVACHVAGNVC